MPATARDHRTPAAVLTLPRHARAAAQARHTVAALAHYDEDVADRGKLLVTEAVANAVEHTDGPSVTVEVRVDHQTGGMFCAVFDTDPAVPLPDGPVHAACTAESGRGLALIKDLSDDWGYFRVQDGKWVWFHLRPAPAAA
ncbi:ATP-binding protein [Streptacidiphilus jiangxiensis]|uniref:Anti-sigma regulatory factor (Ser/Thr protein kinase) n=1 Tax=Streptacidiphilus jiangxiensis TaxID=235985 RepID=A0A1H8BSR7_STRJI|nr:ATP-binding protein [Streptacidiphilus jiangxiensis]SEM85816.1 Anti-sigma regulatory factor (Ser/Thr protein kinase) [Streptacidiphilus jiangxiensis]